jgi:hypothetical protein
MNWIINFSRIFQWKPNKLEIIIHADNILSFKRGWNNHGQTAKIPNSEVDRLYTI